MKNFLKNDGVLTLPTISGALSGQAFVVGTYLPGVLISNAAAATPYNAPVRTTGVVDLSCYGHNGTAGSAIVVGDVLYWTDKDTALNKDTSKKVFGIALGAVNASATATIPVLIKGKSA